MAWKNGAPDSGSESFNNEDKESPSPVNSNGNATAGKVLGGKPQHEKMTNKISKSWGCG